MSDFSDAFNAGSSAVYRGQQMRSQEAMRRANERIAAQEMALKLAEHDLKVQQFAEVAKAHARYEIMSHEKLPVPLPNGGVAMIPNPAYQPMVGDRILKSYLKTARTPEEASNMAEGAMLANYRQREGQFLGQATPRSPSQIAADKALEFQRTQSGELSKARIVDLQNKGQIEAPQVEKINSLIKALPAGYYLSGFNASSGNVDLGFVSDKDKPPPSIQEANAIIDLRRKVASETDPAKKADLQMQLDTTLEQTTPQGKAAWNGPSVIDVPMGDGTTVKFGFNTPNSGQFLPSADPQFSSRTNALGGTDNFFRSGATKNWQRIPGNIQERQVAMSMHNLAIKHPSLASPVPGSSNQLTIAPDKWAELAVREGITTTLQAQAEKQILNAQQTVSELQDAMRTVRPEDVGAMGWFGGLFLDSWLPQFGFNTADIQRMDNQTKLKSVVEGAMRQVSVDSRFSEGDRAAIKDVLEITKTRASYPKVLQTGNTLITIFSKRALIDATTIGKPSPPWAGNALDRTSFMEAADAGILDDDALMDALKIGKITFDEANQFHDNRPK